MSAFSAVTLLGGPTGKALKPAQIIPEGTVLETRPTWSNSQKECRINKTNTGNEYIQTLL